MFGVITESFQSAISKIRFQDDEKALKRALEELKKSLLKSDVHYKVLKELLSDVELKTKQSGIGKENFLSALKESLHTILTAPGNYGFIFAPKEVVKQQQRQNLLIISKANKRKFYLRRAICKD